MSETTTTDTEVAPEVQDGTAPIEGVEVAAEGQEGSETEQEAAAEPEKPKEPGWYKPAIDRLTREKNEARRERDLLKARIEMLEAGRTPDPAEAQTALTQSQIDAAADRKLAERERTQSQAALIANGVKEMTAAVWDEKTTILTTLGALETPGFLDALLEIPEAPKLVGFLADNPDELTALLVKGPTKMATAMGRMAERLSVDTPSPKPLSKVAAPVRAVGPGRITPPPDVAKMTPKEYIAYRDRTAPKHLGGKGLSA